MFKIVHKRELNANVTLMEIEAPFVARKAKAGQFIIFRIDEKGERVPLTIAGYDREKGTVTIIFQKVGFATIALGALNEGDYIQDFVGPLGKPTEVEGKKKVCVVGGGVGCAIALPSAKAFKEAGAEVTVIVGFRSKDIVILEDEFKACADNLILMTDDGSYGRHGLVTQPLQELLEAGAEFDEVLSLGLTETEAVSTASPEDAEIDALVAQRTAARAAKDWAESDRIRDLLKERGIVIEDTKEGAKWHRV